MSCDAQRTICRLTDGQLVSNIYLIWYQNNYLNLILDSILISINNSIKGHLTVRGNAKMSMSETSLFCRIRDGQMGRNCRLIYNRHLA